MYFFRVTKQVENIERRKKVAKRWKPGEREFNTAAFSLELKRNESVIESAFSLAIERMFLVSLKNKYAGILPNVTFKYTAKHFKRLSL